MFKKILVSNRGEIALRIIRACKEMGIDTVAIYSEVDRFNLHVKSANEAFCLSNEPLAAYLNYRQIIKCAKSSGCDAIHPGYGFISENALFAHACEEAGIVFIGPTAKSIATMGSKIAARLAMQQAGIPVIPGCEQSLGSETEALFHAERLGYPVMLKATYGGGGRGIRICYNDKEVRQQFHRASSEAKKAFGNSEIYMETYIPHPRHIEVQILADNYGNVVHLFERDCSIQRRHQKLIEIAPAPNLSQKTRSKLYAYAIQAAQAVGYNNAGTVEFVLDKDETIYFLEMNPRLQVEHPVTEEITGIDIVQEQIRIANGQELSFYQQDISIRGYAMELRINAEDPQHDFLPSFGNITRFHLPGGPGVRIDSALYMGYTIPPDYDSLCAKLITWHATWPGTIMRAIRALKEMDLLGVKTTIPFYLALLQSQILQSGELDTGLILDHPEWIGYAQQSLPHHKAAIIAAAIAARSNI